MSSTIEHKKELDSAVKRNNKLIKDKIEDIKEIVEEEDDECNKQNDNAYHKEWKYNSRYSYYYQEWPHDMVMVRIDFTIRKERLSILEDIVDLKHNGHFPMYIDDAIMSLVEIDLNSPEHIARDFCERQLKRWTTDFRSRKSLQNFVSDW